ncbi:hypothetical protein SpCBS45565_g01858 [Spizellomyces sp. 'palustris']|nr:hypothetical protein SpCBS45565_g01858 [Spizellomyces sp. 'palustris']
METHKDSTAVSSPSPPPETLPEIIRSWASTPLQEFEAFYGYMSTPSDALLILDACRKGMLHTLKQRPKKPLRTADKTGEDDTIVIRSGTIIVFEENGTRMRRWRDGLKWTPSRISGPFLIYRELDTCQSAPEAAISSPPAEYARGVDPPYSAALTGSASVKPTGLIKKTFAATLQNAKYHIISYYAREDVLGGRLGTPTQWAAMNGLDFDEDVWSHVKMTGGWNLDGKRLDGKRVLAAKTRGSVKTEQNGAERLSPPTQNLDGAVVAGTPSLHAGTLSVTPQGDSPEHRHSSQSNVCDLLRQMTPVCHAFTQSLPATDTATQSHRCPSQTFDHLTVPDSQWAIRNFLGECLDSGQSRTMENTLLQRSSISPVTCTEMLQMQGLSHDETPGDSFPLNDLESLLASFSNSTHPQHTSIHHHTIAAHAPSPSPANTRGYPTPVSIPDSGFAEIAASEGSASSGSLLDMWQNSSDTLVQSTDLYHGSELEGHSIADLMLLSQQTMLTHLPPPTETPPMYIPTTMYTAPTTFRDLPGSIMSTSQSEPAMSHSNVHGVPTGFDNATRRLQQRGAQRPGVMPYSWTKKRKGNLPSSSPASVLQPTQYPIATTHVYTPGIIWPEEDLHAIPSAIGVSTVSPY